MKRKCEKEEESRAEGNKEGPLVQVRESAVALPMQLALLR